MLIVAWMAIIIVRLAFVQIVKHEYYLEIADDLHGNITNTLPQRGVIYDRHGNILAMSVIKESLLIDQVLFDQVMLTDRERAKGLERETKLAQKRSYAVDKIAPILEMSHTEFEQMLIGSNRHLWIRRNLTPLMAEAIHGHLKSYDLKGLKLVEEEQRSYPNQELAAHLLGYLGATEKSDKRVGRAGIEQILNDQLTGREGEYRETVNATGVAYERTYLDPRHGSTVYLTIDHALQRRAELILRQAVEQHGAKGGGIVIMQPGSGEILALANYPTFNPNRIEAQVASSSAYVNQAIVTPYEPGSIFKTITYAAAIDQGIIRPDEMIDCGDGQIAIGSRIIRDTHSYGRISIADSFAKSSNVGAIRVAQRLGKETFYRYIRSFGFGDVTGIGLPAESSGIVHAPERWRLDSIGSVAIGQEISVTLIQAVAAVGAIANNGVLVAPRIVKQIKGDDGKFERSPPPPPRQVIKPETAQQMVKMMQRVVTDGTGRSIRLEGYSVAGKTGTPQKSGQTGYAPGRYMPSFLGFVPAVNPRFAIVVMIDEPTNGSYYGGVVAAPVFAMVAEAALAGDTVEPDEDYRGRIAELVKRGAETASGQDLADGDEALESPEGASQRSALIQVGTPAVVQSNGGSSPPATEIVPQQRIAPPGSGAGGAMPNLRGQGMKSVRRICEGLGLRVRLTGNGLVFRQYPAAGTPVRRGDDCRVELH